MTLKSVLRGSVVAFALAGAVVAADVSAALAAATTDTAASATTTTKAAKPAKPAKANKATKTNEESLASVANPKDTLQSMNIEDKNGDTVGSVKDVMLDKKGRPTAVKADVGGFLGVGSKMVSIKAGSLKFEKDRNILMTKMTKNQIKALPESKT